MTSLSTCYGELSCSTARHSVQIKLEGAQRVHISAKYTIMLWSTRLHVYIRASLVMYLRSRRLPMIMTSSITTACSGVCGKFIGNGVDIFVHFFSTPISILNLTTSSESQENGVSNDILFERKYSQLFTYESNTFLLKHQANRFTDAVQWWRHSLFIVCSQTDGRKRNKNMISACSFTAFTWRI